MAGWAWAIIVVFGLMAVGALAVWIWSKRWGKGGW